jgi:hypothetical protein
MRNRDATAPLAGSWSSIGSHRSTMTLAAMNSDSVDIQISTEKHVHFADAICDMIARAAVERGTGIARRSPEYIASKLREGKSVIALDHGRAVGFCYIESWSHGRFVANSGLIVADEYRKSGLARRIKKEIFKLSRKSYPEARIFSITTSLAVMKLNSDLGYRPVTFSELTDDEAFWSGCKSCPNVDILERNNHRMCLCTGMLYDPASPANFNFSGKSKILERLRTIKRKMFLKKNGKRNGKK